MAAALATTSTTTTQEEEGAVVSTDLLLVNDDNDDNHHDAATINSLFSSVDLLREILSYLIDEPETVLLDSHCTLNKSFYSALMDSPEIWRAVCKHRWISKWGFQHRWETAVLEYENLSPTSSHTFSIISGGQFWRRQYIWHERDAKRGHLTPDELTRLTFDFRFWVLEHFWGQQGVLQTGLNFSVSCNFSFLPSYHHHHQHRQVVQEGDNHDDDENVDDRGDGLNTATTTISTTTTTIGHQGLLSGHPSNRDDLEWFLDEDGLGLQWGKTPHLWPKAQIVRLDSWGWEIRNPNVCLRAFDPSKKKQLTGGHYTSSRTTRDDDTNNNNNDDDDLWVDMISSIESDTVILGPEQGGMGLVRIDVPPVFWEFRQNRFRFPRLLN